MTTLSIIFIIGLALGMMGGKYHAHIQRIDEMSMYLIYLLLFLMGVSLGLNEIVINNIQTIGLTALAITIGGMLGSALCSGVIYSLTKKS